MSNRTLALLAAVAVVAGLLLWKKEEVANVVTAVLTDKERELARIRASVYGAALPKEYGDWLCAIALHESNLNPSATNRSGPDEARGGAWGLFQLTLETARNLGFESAAEELLDADTNCYWATVLAKNASAASVQDLATFWNSGKRRLSDLPAGHVTRTDYVPAILAALTRIQNGAV